MGALRRSGVHAPVRQLAPVDLREVRIMEQRTYPIGTPGPAYARIDNGPAPAPAPRDLLDAARALAQDAPRWGFKFSTDNDALLCRRWECDWQHKITGFMLTEILTAVDDHIRDDHGPQTAGPPRRTSPLIGGDRY